MELKEALDIMLNSKIENEQLNDEQEEAYATILAVGDLDSYLTTDEEKIKFSNSHVMYLMCCRKTGIKRKFYEEIKNIEYCSYDSFEKQLDEIRKNNLDYTLEIISPNYGDSTLDIMIKDIIKKGLLPRKKDIVYRVLYINKFYADACIRHKDELDKMKKEIYKMYDLVIEEMNKDRSKFKEIYDNREKYQ